MDAIHAALLQYLTRLPWQWPDEAESEPGEDDLGEHDETI